MTAGRRGHGLRWSRRTRPTGPARAGYRRRGTEDGAAITDRRNHLLQMLDLQPVIRRVAEAVGPVEEREHDEADPARPRRADWRSACAYVRGRAASAIRAGRRCRTGTASAGISSAETTPPALKSIHRNGSASRLIISAPAQARTPAPRRRARGGIVGTGRSAARARAVCRHAPPARAVRHRRT